jgi:phage-related protein
MANEHRKEIQKGKKLVIYGVVANGKCLVKKFLASLEGVEKARTRVVLEQISNNGTPSNKEKYKHLSDGIYECKGFQARLFCFTPKGEANTLILTHGCIKKKDKLDPEDIEKAKTIRADYLENVRNI